MGPRDVKVKKVPDPTIEHPTDVLVKITTTNICGSDLHMYEGRTEVEKGKILGHENLGDVIEVGGAIKQVKVGDKVCLPSFAIVTGASTENKVQSAVANVTPAGMLAEQHRRKPEPGSAET